jgi:hypothetical protein
MHHQLQQAEDQSLTAAALVVVSEIEFLAEFLA